MPEDEIEPEDQEEEQIDGDGEPSTEVANGPTEQNLENADEGDETDPVEEVDEVVEEADELGQDALQTEEDPEDLREITSVDIKASPTANDNTWSGLSNNDYHKNSLIYELVDNCIGHYNPDVPLKIVLNFICDTDEDTGVSQAEIIEIIDNGKGIDLELLPRAFAVDALAGYHGEANNSEHGYGMKYAIATLCDQPELITKPLGEEYHYSLNKDQIVNLVCGRDLVEDNQLRQIHGKEITDSGTTFILKELNPRGKQLAEKRGKKDDLRDLVLRLGQRFREKLGMSQIFGNVEQRKTAIEVNRMSSDGTILSTRHVSPIEPQYYRCPLTGVMQEPVNSTRYSLSGADPEWEASVEVGVAPDGAKQWRRLEIPTDDIRRKQFHPYDNQAENAGFDIVHRGVVIQTGWMPNKDEIPGWTKQVGVHNNIRGVINLKHGFVSNRVKVSINPNVAWNQLMLSLADFLFKFEHNGEEIDLYSLHLKKAYGEKMSLSELQLENRLRNRLKSLQGTNGRINHSLPPIRNFKPKKVETDFGEPDILINFDDKKIALADSIVVEAKESNADGQDLYQLRMYMDDLGVTHGAIFAPDLSPTGLEAFNYLKSITTDKSNKQWTGKKKYNIQLIKHIEVANEDTEFESD